MTNNSQNNIGTPNFISRHSNLHGRSAFASTYPTRPGEHVGRMLQAMGGFMQALGNLIDFVSRGNTEPNNGSGRPGSGEVDYFLNLDQDTAPTPEPISGSGRIWGDPHFIGADGGKFDIQGRAGGIYNLLSDKGFQMNGRFDAWGSKGATVVGEVGIVAGGNRITVEKDGDVRINGRKLREGQSVTFFDGTTVSKKGKSVEINSPEWDVKITTQGSKHGSYLNIDVSTENAIADGVKPHGLLGQTFDGDGEARNGDKGSGAQGGGAIETVGGSFTEVGDKTTVGSYEVGSMHAIGQGLFSRYGPGNHPVPIDNKAVNAAVTAFGILSMSMLQNQFAMMNSTFNQANWMNGRSNNGW